MTYTHVEEPRGEKDGAGFVLKNGEPKQHYPHQHATHHVIFRDQEQLTVISDVKLVLWWHRVTRSNEA